MSEKAFLASNTLIEHLARGAIGIGSLAVALHVSADHPLLAFALGVLALFAFRGCPVCWAVGLIKTVYSKFFSKK